MPERYFPVRLLILPVVSVLLNTLTCVMRDEGMGVRDNPWDPGGVNWTIDAAPSLCADVDSLWADFDHTDTTGSLQITLDIDDKNFPFDTVSGIVFTGIHAIPLRLSAPYSGTLALDEMKPSTVLRCSTSVIDLRNNAVSAICTVTAPAGVPPLPPSPLFITGSSVVRIKWPKVADASGYLIQTSPDIKGPYSECRTLQQPAPGIDSIVFADSQAGYTPQYYRFASFNASGRAFWKDTILGRLYSTMVAVPQRPAASQGNYIDAIALTIFFGYGYSSLTGMEIQRSIGDTLSFRSIKVVTIDRTAGSTDLTYMDSVRTTQNCHYRVCGIDAQGRCSFPSGITSGFAYRLPGVSIDQVITDSDYIRLTWRTVSGAQYYRIYRSDVSCSERMVLLDTTAGLSYDDPVRDNRLYYYQVRAVDARNKEGGGGHCRSAFLNVEALAAPTGLVATRDLHLTWIGLSWNRVPGAVGYIIRRSATEDVASSKMIDSVGADVLSYSDTVSAAVPYYYWVAAAGRYGTGYLSSGACGFVVRPPAFGISNREAPMLVITWIRHARALRYKIYRSRNDTLGFALRADVADTTYTDTANDCAVYYYRMSIETLEGTSLFGDFVPVTSFLDPPSGFTAVEYDAGVLLKWRPVHEDRQSQREFAGTLHRWRHIYR